MNKKEKKVYLASLIESYPTIAPKCESFGICGGCKTQNLSYDDEINLKEQFVLKLFKDEGIENFGYIGIEKTPVEYKYRNKMEFTFGDDGLDGNVTLGMRKKNSFYEVVNATSCNICDEDFNEIVKATLEYFKQTDETFHHKGRHTGNLRNLVVRKGFFTGEILVNIVTTSLIKADMNGYAKCLENLKLKGNIVGILHTLNDTLADIVRSDETRTLFGRDYFYENLLGLKFKISAFSFFQTNSSGAEVLYETIKEFCGNFIEERAQTVFDLYCGTGTIAQVLAKDVSKIVGVEIVQEAIDAAIENAKLNNIENCKFICGDVLKVVGELENAPDLIILDPPREGVQLKALEKIVAFNAKKIVYVSCKPSSLVKDLTFLTEHGYAIEKTKMHDMFSKTANIETVVLLVKTV